MLKPTVHFDQAGFRREGLRLMALKNISVEKLVRDQSRLFARDVLRITPPFGRHSITESFNVQRRTGEAAVKRDLGRVFMGPKDLSVLKHPKSPRLAKNLEQAIRARDTAAVQAILEKIGLQVKVIEQPDATIHRGARNRRGRVRGNREPMLVLDQRALDRYVKDVVGHVGKTKAGWLPAAAALGVTGIPNWIRRHGGQTPGLIRFEGRGNKFAVVIGNLVAWGQAFSELRIVEEALKLRVRAMRLNAEHIIAGDLRKGRR